MGVNFTALFDYSSNKQVLKYLTMMLNDKTNFENHFSDVKSNNEIEHETRIGIENRVFARRIEDEFDEIGYVNISGPEGLELYIGKHLCELTSPIRWNTFLSDQLTQEKLRRISLELSKIFGYPIYAPDSFCLDSYLFDGNKIDKVNDYLIEKYGPPSSSLNEMLDDYIKNNEHRTYYFENFEDLLS